MLELELKWFLVLVANFLVLIYLLNVILFRPLLAVFAKRREAVESATDAARKMVAEKDESLRQMKADLSEAARGARAGFDALRAEGLGQQRAALEAAGAEAAEIINKAREELRAEAARARGALKADVKRFSEEIVGKLMNS